GTERNAIHFIDTAACWRRIQRSGTPLGAQTASLCSGVTRAFGLCAQRVCNPLLLRQRAARCCLARIQRSRTPLGAQTASLCSAREAKGRASARPGRAEARPSREWQTRARRFSRARRSSPVHFFSRVADGFGAVDQISTAGTCRST